MLLKTVFVTTRDRVRLRAIGQVLINYGLQDLVHMLGLSSLFGRYSRSTEPSENQPQRLRQALESLGPTFVKLGQILATRSDLLSDEWTQELEQLHSNVTTLPWESMSEQITASLSAPVEEIFAEFNTTPLAAASMAQVYRARLHSGEDVVVKVLRPDLAKTIHADLRLLAWLAEIIEQQSPQLARFSPSLLVRQLATALNHELDLCHEAANTQHFERNFRHRPDIVIPRIWPQYSSTRLLVQEFIPGTKPQNTEQLALAGFHGPTLAARGALAFMQMVFEDRLYHADPHAGNLMALPGNRVAFIDFGMVGQLSIRRRNQLLSLMQALANRDCEGLVSVLIKWSSDSIAEVGVLEQAAQDFLERLGYGELKMGKALMTMLSIAREYQLSLPPDLVLLFKALITADGVLHRIDPEFDIIKTLKPFLRNAVIKRYSLRATQRRTHRMGIEMLEASEELPQVLNLLVRRIRQGKAHVDIDMKNLSSLGGSLERSALTLAIAIVTAAFALGIAPWLLSQTFSIFGIPIFPTLSALLVLGGIVWLAWRMWRL
ncbi:AarF/ABC1/UbiB kinase family protein [Budviciaceae bacterium CWB-B4]|uniref:AarF/ABC1/UbiB kinase family protein n=1 Tax=Limnobaculum xujianqingii TaxID=2738837 RepID=A0A9D7AJW5_9GAMM|nr:AarF/ABC1/UbiB kinase family protein [Limnobaculum xujianqingii]MBK5074242.1 AarF/ABC1/UbiB kinase family protein [Limnobaculum xujianqingii]MBK5177551.1 AarF/ABC1/UbiB kinase family protein [Limnobaculum xujianqingii]